MQSCMACNQRVQIIPTNKGIGQCDACGVRRCFECMPLWCCNACMGLYCADCHDIAFECDICESWYAVVDAPPTATSHRYLYTRTRAVDSSVLGQTRLARVWICVHSLFMIRDMLLLFLLFLLLILRPFPSFCNDCPPVVRTCEICERNYCSGCRTVEECQGAEGASFLNHRGGV